MNDFKDVQAFFKSWGLYPAKEDTDDHNPRVIEQGINRACYFKLTEEAQRLYGEKYVQFCSRVINATDDAFYLRLYTWDEMKEMWDTHNKGE